MLGQTVEAQILALCPRAVGFGIWDCGHLHEVDS